MQEKTTHHLFFFFFYLHKLPFAAATKDLFFFPVDSESLPGWLFSSPKSSVDSSSRG